MATPHRADADPLRAAWRSIAGRPRQRGRFPRRQPGTAPHGRHDPFCGPAIAPGGPARRDLPPSAAGSAGVDRRGWTFDRCWEDPTWDPQWYVAARRESGNWTVEAAIGLKELTGQPPRPGDVWALGVQGVVPGVGFQSWTAPAAAATILPDGFGYLVFQ